MENFSTQRRATVPRAANLSTLVVLLMATWWSNAQRPVEQTARAPIAATQGATAALPLPRAADLAEVESTTGWPAQSSAATRDGLQTVGFQAGAPR
jgi:hypothetical protein